MNAWILFIYGVLLEHRIYVLATFEIHWGLLKEKAPSVYAPAMR
jgi:hypothetical protein